MNRCPCSPAMFEGHSLEEAGGSRLLPTKLMLMWRVGTVAALCCVLGFFLLTESGPLLYTSAWSYVPSTISFTLAALCSLRLFVDPDNPKESTLYGLFRVLSSILIPSYFASASLALFFDILICGWFYGSKVTAGRFFACAVNVFAFGTDMLLSSRIYFRWFHILVTECLALIWLGTVLALPSLVRGSGIESLFASTQSKTVHSLNILAGALGASLVVLLLNRLFDRATSMVQTSDLWSKSVDPALSYPAAVADDRADVEAGK